MQWCSLHADERRMGAGVQTGILDSVVLRHAVCSGGLLLLLLLVCRLLRSVHSGRLTLAFQMQCRKNNANLYLVVQLREIYCHLNSTPAGLFNSQPTLVKLSLHMTVVTQYVNYGPQGHYENKSYSTCIYMRNVLVLCKFLSVFQSRCPFLLVSLAKFAYLHIWFFLSLSH